MNLKYIFDPVCGWCYGSLPNLKKIASEDGFELEILPSGMFAQEQALHLNQELANNLYKICQRIWQITGQTFSRSFIDNILFKLDVLDSYAPTLAIVASKWTNYETIKQVALLEMLQDYLNREGIDITNLPTLIALLKDDGFNDIATILESNDSKFINYYNELINETRHTMRQHYINGVPALLRNDKLIDNGILYLKPEHTIDSLKN